MGKTAVLILILASIAMVLTAGCTSSSTSSQSTPSITSSGGSSGGAVQVQVSYSGSWTGAIDNDGTEQSVNGHGPQTFDLTTSPGYIVSVEFQKSDDSTDTLTASIIEDGQIIKTASTGTAYGVVSTVATV